MSKHIVATVDEIPVGMCKIVEIKGRSIGVFNVKGEFFALRNRCPHEGAALCEGTIAGLRQADQPGDYRYERAGEIIRCPWHGWEFDIKTGQSWFDPNRVRIKALSLLNPTSAATNPAPIWPKATPFPWKSALSWWIYRANLNKKGCDRLHTSAQA